MLGLGKEAKTGAWFGSVSIQMDAGTNFPCAGRLYGSPWRSVEAI
jgi:hypothetical protein